MILERVVLAVNDLSPSLLVIKPGEVQELAQYQTRRQRCRGAGGSEPRHFLGAQSAWECRGEAEGDKGQGGELGPGGSLRTRARWGDTLVVET